MLLIGNCSTKQATWINRYIYIYIYIYLFIQQEHPIELYCSCFVCSRRKIWYIKIPYKNLRFIFQERSPCTGRIKQVVDRGIGTMGLIRSIYFVVIAVAFTEGRSSHKNTSNSVLVWWEKKPLVFRMSGGKNPTDGGALGGLLPEIWPTVAKRCREFLPRSYTDGFRRRQIAKPLSKLDFAQEMGPGDLLMPIKLRKSKEAVLGMPFVKLLDSPGVRRDHKESSDGNGFV